MKREKAIKSILFLPTKTFIHMSSITFPIKKNQLITKMISTVIERCFHRKVYGYLFSTLERSVKKKNFYLPFKTTKDVLVATGRTDKRTEQAFTDIKKAGLVIKHNGRLILNPLVYTRKTYTDRLENIIYYYYLLFNQETFNREGIPITLDDKGNLDFTQVKKIAVEAHVKTPSKQDRREQILLNELDDIFTQSNKTSTMSNDELETFDNHNQNTVAKVYDILYGPNPVPANYRATSRTVDTRYRSFLSDYIVILLNLHIQIFSEQNLVKHKSGVEYDFYFITTASQKDLIDYKKTSIYQRITSPMPQYSIDPLEEHFKNIDGVISTTASEHIKNINQDKVCLPVNMTNEINPIEDEQQEDISSPNLFTATYLDTIRKENQAVSYHSYNVTTNMNSNSKVSINPPEEYTGINKLKQKVEEQFQAHLKNIDHQPPKYNSVFKYRELREAGLVKHLEENNEPPYIPQPVYPKCNLRDAELSRELYYSELQ